MKDNTVADRRRIKVVYLITSLIPAGAERVVYALAKHLPASQFDIEVICVSAVRGQVGTWLSESGIRVWYLDVKYKWQLAIKFFRLWRLINSLQPQILHAHLFHCNMLARCVGRLTAVPVILSTVHIMEQRWRPWHFFLDRWTISWTNLQICVSHTVAQFTREKAKIPANKIAVIVNGVPVEQFANVDVNANSKSQWPLEGRQVIGAVGRLDPQKGFAYLIKALPAVIQKFADVVLLVVGAGAQKHHLEKLANQLNLQQHVIFTGFQEQTAPFYRLFDVFVCPSIYEGFGLVLVEAMIAGCPVIASAIKPFAEIVEDGKWGKLVPPASRHALANAIIEVLASPEQARHLAAKASIYARENFSVRRMVEQYQSLYIRAASSKPLDDTP